MSLWLAAVAGAGDEGHIPSLSCSIQILIKKKKKKLIYFSFEF